MPVVVAHGGAASSPLDADGPQRACGLGLAVLAKGGTPLDAAILGCAMLEDDPRFNAGTGSNLRLDGKTIETDAAVMTSEGKFGAVACLQGIRNPVLVARDVHATPHNLLAGAGALAYARARGHPVADLRTPQAERRFDEVRRSLRLAKDAQGNADWDMARLAMNWNYQHDLALVFGSGDTVGVLAWDGDRYAAASSTGGTISTLLGRVGDVPLPGCGIHAGPDGAVAVTGAGDFLARKLLASRLYGAMAAGTHPDAAIRDAVALFPPEVDLGAIVLWHGEAFSGGNRDMAWATERA